MRKLILLALIAFSCVKKEITPKPEPEPTPVVCVDTTFLFDVTWEYKNHITAPKRLFRKDRFYFEDDSLMGTWKIKYNCYLPIITITEKEGRPAIPEPLVYDIKIKKATKDTLITTEWNVDFYIRK